MDCGAICEFKDMRTAICRFYGDRFRALRSIFLTVPSTAVATSSAAKTETLHIANSSKNTGCLFMTYLRSINLQSMKGKLPANSVLCEQRR